MARHSRKTCSASTYLACFSKETPRLLSVVRGAGVFRPLVAPLLVGQFPVERLGLPELVRLDEDIAQVEAGGKDDIRVGRRGASGVREGTPIDPSAS